MGGLEGSTMPQSRIGIHSSLHHRPQILRPAPNRHFPLPVLPDLHPSSPPDPEDKPRIPLPQSPLKPKTEECEVENGVGEAEQGVKEEIMTHILPLMSETGVKHNKKRKPSKHRRAVLQALESTDGISADALSPNNCRYDSSLRLLTKRFVNLIKQTEGCTLDLNEAAEVLKVQKRRIYDITNVLEGVGLMQKSVKNRITWRGDDILSPMELDNQVAGWKAANDVLHEEDSKLDGMIREMQENLRVLTEDRKFQYLTKEDICSLPHFQNSTLIAVKAPHGTSIEVPDPDEYLDFPQRRYQIFLRSSMGPINCLLMSKHEGRLETSKQDQKLAPNVAIENKCNNKDDESCLHQAHNTATTSGPIQDPDAHMTCPDPMLLQDHADGIVKIVPSDSDVDADYWLESDYRGNITDMWTSMVTKNGASSNEYLLMKILLQTLEASELDCLYKEASDCSLCTWRKEA